MRIHDSIVEECKEFIDQNKLEEFQEYIQDLFTYEFPQQPDWPTVFQQVYLHACLRKRNEIAEYLETLFGQFDPITQIAYRQVFFYGKYLLKKSY
jgi:hypothetical protein